jgi:hypothetical protein
MISVRTVAYIIVMILTVATATGLPVLIDACCTDVATEHCTMDSCCPEGSADEEPCCELVVSVQHADQGSAAKEGSLPAPVLSLDQTVQELLIAGAESAGMTDGHALVEPGRYRTSLVLSPRSEHTGSFLI